MKCSKMMHLIWVFSVCKNTRKETVTIDELHREYYMHETMIHTSKTFNNSDMNFYAKYVDKMLSRLRC